VKVPSIVKPEWPEIDAVGLGVGHDFSIDLAPELLRESRIFLAFIVPEQERRAEIGRNGLEEFVPGHRLERDRALLVAFADQR